MPILRVSDGIRVQKSNQFPADDRSIPSQIPADFENSTHCLYCYQKIEGQRLIVKLGKNEFFNVFHGRACWNLFKENEEISSKIDNSPAPPPMNYIKNSQLLRNDEEWLKSCQENHRKLNHGSEFLCDCNFGLYFRAASLGLNYEEMERLKEII